MEENVRHGLASASVSVRLWKYQDTMAWLILLHHKTTNLFCTLSLTNCMKLTWVNICPMAAKKTKQNRGLVVRLSPHRWTSAESPRTPPPRQLIFTDTASGTASLQAETLPQLSNRTIPILNPLCLASVGVQWNETVQHNEFGVSGSEHTLDRCPKSAFIPSKGADIALT